MRSKENDTYKPASKSFVGNKSSAICGLRLVNLAVEHPSRIHFRGWFFSCFLLLICTLLGWQLGIGLITLLLTLDHPVRWT